MLVVDDDKHLRTLVKTYAEIDGFLLIEATNGTEAINQVMETNFDIIILDREFYNQVSHLKNKKTS